jgi:hypothetical protein
MPKTLTILKIFLNCAQNNYKIVVRYRYSLVKDK